MERRKSGGAGEWHGPPWQWGIIRMIWGIIWQHCNKRHPLITGLDAGDKNLRLAHYTNGVEVQAKTNGSVLSSSRGLFQWLGGQRVQDNSSGPRKNRKKKLEWLHIAWARSFLMSNLDLVTKRLFGNVYLQNT